MPHLVATLIYLSQIYKMFRNTDMYWVLTFTNRIIFQSPEVVCRGRPKIYFE